LFFLYFSEGFPTASSIQVALSTRKEKEKNPTKQQQQQKQTNKQTTTTKKHCHGKK